MTGLTLFFKRFNPHRLMKAQEMTLVSFFYLSTFSDRILFDITELHLCSCAECGPVSVRKYDICMSPSAGEAMVFTRQYLLTPVAGRRPRVPGAVVIIADKKSDDNLTLAASNLRATGVSSVRL